MLESATYDATRQILYLRFRKAGDVYLYFGFSAAEYQAFLTADSHGRFFLARICSHYRYEHTATLRVA